MATMLAALALAAVAQMPPVPNPRKPTPLFSWDMVPIAFHGANRSGPYNALAVAALAKHSMVTIEKWYTLCGSRHPIQAGPWCDVEKAMYATFNQLKAIKPNITTIMCEGAALFTQLLELPRVATTDAFLPLAPAAHPAAAGTAPTPLQINTDLNSMFDFSMYNLDALIQEREAAGQRILLRDKNDKLVLLCNDGNFYCNVTNLDWSQEAARSLWLEEVANATSVGGVDGIFADHASAMLQPPDDPTLCNGKGSGRSCWHFTPEFADEFNAGHRWLINHTQNVVTGPVVDGPYSRWGVPACNFEGLRDVVEQGKAGTGPFVIEASRGACTPDESCLAGFLMAAAEYTYLTCFADEPVVDSYPDLLRPLGPPLSDAVEGPPGEWTRKFASGTVVKWYSEMQTGTVQWPGDPPPPVPPPPPPPEPLQPQCGKALVNTGQGWAEISNAPATSPEACCAMCLKVAKCAIWAWHGEESPPTCHLHTAEAQQHSGPKGCISGHVNRTVAHVA